MTTADDEPDDPVLAEIRRRYILGGDLPGQLSIDDVTSDGDQPQP